MKGSCLKNNAPMSRVLTGSWFLASGLIASGLFLSGLTAQASQLPAGSKANSKVGFEVKDITLADNGTINVVADFDLSKVEMKGNAENVFTPMYVNGTDTLRFDSFSVLGRNRYYYLLRNGEMPASAFYKGEPVNPSGYTAFPSPANGTTTLMEFDALTHCGTLYLSAPMQEWLRTATLTVDVEARGCANCHKDVEGMPEKWFPVAQNDFVVRLYTPELLYVTPVAEAVKMREISARAYIDFPVNRTEIYPDYRRNPQELAKIRATIDSVKNDKDINITSLHISGTASPEGSYQNNVRLAKGRTESLKNYVQGLYRFPAGLITSSFEPVDWKGLAEFLEMVASLGNGPTDSIRMDQFKNIPFDPATIRSILPNAEQILGIVNSDIEPVNRNNKIKQTYKNEYAWLLQNVYPALRHSDYRIEFEIKTYTEVSEIIDVMAVSPQKLSLAELFVAANSQPVGSEIYNRAFELAVTMYPNDAIANLNAANNALQRGDYRMAERYMQKSGDSDEARYQKAVKSQMEGNQSEALEIYRSLTGSSNPEVAGKSQVAVEAIEEIINARPWWPLD